MGFALVLLWTLFQSGNHPVIFVLFFIDRLINDQKGLISDDIDVKGS